MAKVFGDFDVILHPGIAREEFITFVQRTSPMHEPWPGIRAYVLSGDRGDGEGRLHYLIDMASEQIRNRYFPPDTTDISIEGMERWEAMTDFILAWEQFAHYGAGRTPWTDYVVIGEF